MSSSSTSYSTFPPPPPPEETTTQSNETQTPKQPLALPEAPLNTTQLDISSGSTSVKLDHLGPMVVNVDGTLSRISNWEQMAEIERENTVRIIGVRNRTRLRALREKEGGKEGGEGNEEGK
ncbi:hypothetical protein ONS95_002499 [Cadophora gregata]|uniref:uncharacterized protein n=1 Tax=Cadophora gregata TaxID=51156 RepID=UPI0026DBD495|nr:uncharacterized protein ONS95_002499 [Cadophora gregata]KAK0109828.1 hypothetical protein ONS95_002499 [Cadophora gregata]